MTLSALSFILENELDLDKILFPIPFKEFIRISFHSNLAEKTRINDIEMNAQVLFRHIGLETQKGVNLCLLDLQELPAGM